MRSQAMNFHAMEQDNSNSHEITSSDVEKLLEANIIYLKKKRKSQVQQEGLPLLKHKCWDRNLNSDSQSNENLIKAVSQSTKDESELESVKDGNSLNEDTMDYTSASASNEEKTISEISNSTTDKSATLSVTCSEGSYGSFNNSSHSLVSSSISPNSGGENNYPNNDFGLHSCLSYEEALLELGCHVDSSGSVENESNGSEQCKEKGIDEMCYSNGMLPNYVLSSGKWSFNQDNQGGAKKLTIDKEFEEYFSMLML